MFVGPGYATPFWVKKEKTSSNDADLKRYSRLTAGTRWRRGGRRYI